VAVKSGVRRDELLNAQGVSIIRLATLLSAANGGSSPRSWRSSRATGEARKRLEISARCSEEMHSTFQTEPTGQTAGFRSFLVV
jgi:hypothetical protein